MDSLERGRFFLPGPTEVHPDVLAAQAQPMIGHRGPAIEELMERLERGLRPVFVTDRPVIISTSSATGLMEAAVRNGVSEGRILSLVNGAFSLRFSEIARMCGHEVEVWEVPWGEVHAPEALAKRLSEGGYDAVTLTQSETSTGALQDLEALAAVVGEQEETLLLVDSVTGVGGVETRTDEWGVDFIVTGSQKALALPPGLAFGVASEALLERSRGVPDRGWYFDLDRLSRALANHQTPATPAISLLYALDLQLIRIAEEGIEKRWKRHLAMQQRTLEWVAEMREVGVAMDVLAGEGRRSPTVTCIAFSERGKAPAVVAGMRERGWVIGAGYGKLKDSTIRIGHMGDHTVEELESLLAVLAEVVR
ncbi:MAG TPA: alanine--glyoxylate aminotransferase family protein [Acidimicrobiia bacterium]|nr:alanine--glyoxylate aminotransferase family protein [Acidimicrobiia bacterium]